MGFQRLVWREGAVFTGVDSWGHQVEIGGDGQGVGLKPSDLLPLSLAACTAYDLVTILAKQRQQLSGLEAAIESEQEADPPWTFRAITVHFTLRGDLDPKKVARALQLSEERYCSVAATLRSVVRLSFDYQIVSARE
ncbi:MAG: OsmC family protein [Dehalococcoidia bacterium]